MQAFTFASPLLSRDLHVQQKAAGVIGFKVYPGALVLAQYLERAAAGTSSTQETPGLAAANAALNGNVVIELGSGVCGLPSLVLGGYSSAPAERRVIATDVPVMLPLLHENVVAAGSASVVDVAPLTWGAANDVPALVTKLRSEGRGPPSAIVGADIVYHDPLIDPLLDALRRLTDPGTWGDSSPPPPVLMAYVQRFKRAKAFFKKAKKWFDVQCIPMGPVVDYDALTWHGQQLQRAAGAGAAGSDGHSNPSSGTPVLDSGSAGYERYLWAVCAAGDALRERQAAEGVADGSSQLPVTASEPAVFHAVDSDSQEDDPGKSPGIGLFAGFDCGPGESVDAAAGNRDERDASGAGMDAKRDEAYRLRQLRASASAAAQLLGLPQLAEPLDAYVYVLTRRAPA